MCGLFGTTDAGLPGAKFIEAAKLANQYRGPDETTVRTLPLSKGSIILGHTRLIITGNNQRGAQPCVSPGNRYMVYNGEIFNFENVKVDGLSDTEVLFNKFATDVDVKSINDLNGFFAIALVCPNTNRVFLIRDRFGEKPLYYLLKDNKLYFSSSILPLAGLCELSDMKEASELSGGGILIDEQSPYGNIKQVKPGCCVIYQEGNLSEVNWYQPQNIDLSNISFRDAVNQYENLLIDAVRIRVKDQNKIAIALSAGLDSTLVADTIHKFTDVKAEAYILATSDKRFNEYNAALNIACKIGISLHPILEREHAIQDVYRCLNVLEVPSFNFSFIGYDYFYSEIASKGVRVILEGHGPDEYMGGYGAMHRDYLAGQILTLHFRNFYQGLIKHCLKFNVKKHRAIASVLKHSIKSLINGTIPSGSATNKKFFKELSMPVVLRTFDRLSMLNGIETRSPFMDYRLVEFGLALPDRICFHGGESKAVIKQILKNRGFQDSDFGVKVGFTANYSKVLSSLARDMNFYNKNISEESSRFKLHKISYKIANEICKQRLHETNLQQEIGSFKLSN